jgi:DNA adenine methylase
MPATPQAVARRPVPFLKWAGGKTQLLKQLAAYLPGHFNRYYEPFLGGGALFLRLQPQAAVLNDSNPALIAAYRHVQSHLDELLALLCPLRQHYHTLDHDAQQAYYYRQRQRYNQLPVGTLEKSALLIFLNKTCYNGLYRENGRGAFNVPFGRYTNPAMFAADNLRAVARALRDATLVNSDFAAAVATAQAGDFVYFDPPYMPLSATAAFTHYTGDDFGPTQQATLADTARELAQRGVLVMLSNSDTPFIRDLYRDFEQHQVGAIRAINSNRERRGRISELVMTSYAVAASPPQ